MTIEAKPKPMGYDAELTSFKDCIFDAHSGEPIGWGFEIRKHVGEPRFNALRQFGELSYAGGKWFLITHWLTRQEAEQKYGPVTNEVFGPKGGFKTVTFGSTTFMSKHLRPVTS